jgi:hypothetical protein
MGIRHSLLAAPAEYFTAIFNHRVPTMQEKLITIERCVQAMTMAPRFQNDTYDVMVMEDSPFVHLVIHRHDWEACVDWREFQQIKNELVGPECEAMDLYPAESRLVDTSNAYHLWVHRDPTFRFPVGHHHRMLTSTALGFEKQRAPA